VDGRDVAGVGVIGAGTISEQYLGNLAAYPDVEVRSVADLDVDRAAAQAAAHGVPHAGGVDELLAREDVDVVVDLTVPAAHVEVGLRVLDAGKHLWSEKPLATDRDGAAALLARARSRGLRCACAPDTVLGAGVQNALRLVAGGGVGRPLTATAVFQTPGPESWHPSPEFLYGPGGGPLMDMGPYYVTALVHLLGPVERVTAVASTSRRRRTVATGPRAGTSFDVTVPSHHAALVEFEGGGSAQYTFSFEHARARTGVLEVNGTAGTVALPDVNRFDGSTHLWRDGSAEPEEVLPPDVPGGRGIGVVDLVRSLRAGRPEVASGDLAAHVLDVLLAVAESAEERVPVAVRSTAEVPPPLDADWDPARPDG